KGVAAGQRGGVENVAAVLLELAIAGVGRHGELGVVVFRFEEVALQIGIDPVGVHVVRELFLHHETAGQKGVLAEDQLNAGDELQDHVVNRVVFGQQGVVFVADAGGRGQEEFRIVSDGQKRGGVRGYTTNQGARKKITVQSIHRGEQSELIERTSKEVPFKIQHADVMMKGKNSSWVRRCFTSVSRP